MSKKRSQGFSLTFKALRLQLATLMDDVGGDDALELMDGLADLSPETRKSVLNVFNNLLGNLNHSREFEVASASDFEEKLYSGIMQDFREFNSSWDNTGEVVDLEEYRKSRRG